MAATRKKKRKREEEEDTENQKTKTKRKLLLGSRVEIRSLEEGWAGSWHCGTVVACSHLCRVVEYDHFYLDDEGLENLKQKVHVSPLLEGILLPKGFSYRGIIRPIPPPCENDTVGGLNFGLCVDAFIDEAWWEGVIFGYEDKLLERLVFFPDFSDRQMIKTDELRVTQDWDEIEECWIVRGKWKFLELIEDYPIAVVKAAQIWHDLRQKDGFKNNIKEWTCNVKSMWVDLVVETVSQNLDISAELTYKVISEKIDNYSANDNEECRANRVSSCDEGILPTCYTANGEDEVQGVGTVVACTSFSNVDDDQTYSESSLKRLTGMGLSQKRIQTPADSGSTGKLMWLLVDTDVLPEAKYFPEALEKYLMTDVVQVKNNDSCARDLRLEARMHLSYMGWTIEYKIRTKSKRADIRYISPKGGTPLYSLRRACLQAMKFARRRMVPLSVIYSREDKGCASPPLLCLEPDSLYSKTSESHKTPYTRGKLDVHVEPEYCPQAVRDYLNGYQCNGRRLKHAKNVNHLREKVKKHLSAEGWTFSLHFLKDDRRDLRYTTPSNSASFKSLVAACKGYVKEVSERMSPSSHDKFLSTAMHPEIGKTARRPLQDESERNWQNCEPCIAKKCSLDDYRCAQEKTLQVDSEQTPQNTELGVFENSALAVYDEHQQEKRGLFCVKFYTQGKMLGAHVNTPLAAENSEQLTTLHIDGSHSCQDVVEEDRIDTSNSQELGKQKKRKRIVASSSDTINKPFMASNADVSSYAPRAATRASEESEKRTPHIGCDPCCQDVSEEGTYTSPASEQLEKPTPHIGCPAASEEDDLKRRDFDDSDGEGTGMTVVLEDDSEDDAVESQILNLDFGTGELENSDRDGSFTQLVDDFKRRGFDDSDGEGTGMTLVLEDDSDLAECEIGSGGDTPTSCFRKRRHSSPCEPSLKDNVVLDSDTPAEKSASALWGPSEAAACIETKNICDDGDNEMAGTTRDPITVIATLIDEPKRDHSACDENQNMKEGKDVSAVSVLKKLSYGDASILNDLVRFNDNDSIDGVKDTLSPGLVHEPAGVSYFADSHDDPGKWSGNNDVVDKFLSLNYSNLTQEMVPKKIIKGINFSASRFKGACELAKRRTIGSPIRDMSIFDWHDSGMHDNIEDGEPDSISCKRETKDENGLSLARRIINLARSDSRLLSDDLKGVRQVVVTSELESNINSLDLDEQLTAEEVQEAVISNNGIGKYDAGFDTQQKRSSVCSSKIPAEPPEISNKLASAFICPERAVASVMAVVVPAHIPTSEESEQPTLAYMGPILSEEDTMTTTSSNSQEQLVKQQKKLKRIDEAHSSGTTTADGKVDSLIEIIGKHFKEKEDILRRREVALEKQQISLMKLQMALEKQRSLLEKKSSLADGFIKALYGLKDLGRISFDEEALKVCFKASELIG
ncbi:hypothetical protein MKX01_035314 [Papaver californicum]|nr:hypothetical protein MKX01_035314 [Papaver californicum]